MMGYSKVALSFGSRTPEAKRDPYREALRGAGLDLAEDAATLAGLHGLVLTGGTDVDPALYREQPRPETQEPDQERDEREWRLLEKALKSALPVLAICRGMQFFNVFHGGTLTQHIEGHRSAGKEAHLIKIEAGTKLASILRPGDYGVNSRHHQAVSQVGRGLIVSAVAPDGVIEALELPGRQFAIAVQWHPEERVRLEGVPQPDQQIFQAFAEAARPVRRRIAASK